METNKTIKNYNRYENSKIYKLIYPDSGYYYIGSTTNRLSARLSLHTSRAKLKPDTKVY